MTTTTTQEGTMQDTGSIVIDTPEGIEMFALRQVIGCLKIEATTGMRHSRGSVLKLAQQRYGVTAKTKMAAYQQLCELWKEITGEYPTGYVAR